MIVGLCWILLFLFVPETFWERHPRPHSRQGSKRSSVSGFTIFRRRVSNLPSKDVSSQVDGSQSPAMIEKSTPAKMEKHVGFAASQTSDHAVESSTGEQSTGGTSTALHETSPAADSEGAGMLSQTTFKLDN